MRYADLFMYYVSLYNTLMKIFFISATAFIIFMIRFKKPYCTVSILLLFKNGQFRRQCILSTFLKFQISLVSIVDFTELIYDFYLYRPMMLLVMISHISWLCYQLHLYWPAWFNQDGLHGNSYGATVYGSNLLLSCHRLLC